MAFTTSTLTGDLADFIGTDYDPAKVSIVLEASDPILSDGATKVRVGNVRGTIAADGTFSFAGIPNTVSGAPVYRVVITWTDAGTRKPRQQPVGWFAMTANADLAAKVSETFTPTVITPTVAANIQAAAALGATNDTATASYVNNPASATSGALKATYAPNAQGNTFICAGDSLSSFDFTNNIPHWAKITEALTDGRATLLRYAGVSGNTAAQLLARLQVDVIAYKPAFVTVLIGTNDVSGATPDATFKANITEIHDKLRAAGIVSAVCTIPPRNDVAAYLTTIGKWNAWLKKFAADTNRPLLDFHGQVVDYMNGQLRADCSHDGVHLSTVGHAVIGKHLAGLVPSLLRPYTALRAVSNTDPINLVSNGLLLTGSPTPTGFTPAGSATGTTETLVTTDTDFRGNCWEWVMNGTAAAVGFRQFQTLLTGGGGLVGKTLRFQARVKVVSQAGLDQGEGVDLAIVFDGAVSGGVQRVSQGIHAPGTNGLYYKDFVVPAGTINIYFQPSIAVDLLGEAVTARVGEIAAFDLTALGIA